MQSSISFNNKATNNINNMSPFYNKIRLNQYNNYQPNKIRPKSKNQKIILNPAINNDENINKQLNNSSYNVPFKFHRKTNIENNSLNKNKKENIFKKQISLDKKVKFYRNNNEFKNSLNNSLNNTSFDFFKKRMNYFNNKFNLLSKNNIKPIKSFSKINKRNKSNNNIKNSKIYNKDTFNKINKSAISKRPITPILSSRISKNNSKSKNKSKVKSNHNSKEKKIDNNFYNNLLYPKSNININNKIKKNYDFNHNIRTTIFQPNNIFAQFKPKKKIKTIIHQEEFQMEQKQNELNTNKVNKEKNNINNNINKNINNNVNKNINVIENCFIEIHPKIIQQESEKNLKSDEESNKEILPLTNNSTTINILNSTNTHSKSNSNIKSYSNLKIQTTNNINFNNNDSNIHLQKLDIQSSLYLNENNHININNINTILEKKQQAFKGKKIKCIHDISKTGLAGVEKKINQDRDFIFRNFVEGFDNIFMGVCDGHGFYGNEVSEYIKENLPMDLNRIIKTRKLDLNKDDLSEVIINTFLMENNSLLRNKQIDSDLSGSTCISVIYTPQKLIIANVGDSRCVLGSRTAENEWKFKNLSRDHKPNIKEEADRIKKTGGRIRPMIDDDGCFVGPLRVYMKDKDLPGLAMTRSFGDYFASIAGTIAVPEIKEHLLVPEDKFLILASDGLFEFMSSEEVGIFVKSYYEKNDIVGCCEFLYKESYRKWICEEEDTVDDITIILVFFEEE